MELSVKIFGKPLDLMTLEDLQNYFTVEREESKYLEFKSGDVKISDIFREICAFLNSDGGIMVIGAPRETKVVKGDLSVRICKGKLTSSAFKSKNWIENRIAGNIVPFPEDIHIKEFRSADKNQYVIDIPRSKNPPHQVRNEGRYYVRVHQESRPAPHEKVRALFLKNEKPVISSKFYFRHPEIRDNQLVLRITFENSSAIPVKSLSCKLDLVNVLALKSEGRWEEITENNSYTIDFEMNKAVVEEVTAGYSWEIEHKYQPFIVYLMMWNEKVDVSKRGVLYDPENRIILVDTANIEGRKPNLLTLKSHLREIISYL